MARKDRGLAVVTGAATGIGFELARVCAREGFDLLIVDGEAVVHAAADSIRGASAATVQAVQADLATVEGVEAVIAGIGGRHVAALLANTGGGPGGAFLNQDWSCIRHAIDTDIIGMLHLIHRVAKDMSGKRAGRILIIGSVADPVPGACPAVHNASKAFFDSFSAALRAELLGHGVTVTSFVPGAVETAVLERAEAGDRKPGAASKGDPAGVARTGYDAMMDGDRDVLTWMTRLRAAFASVAPAVFPTRMNADEVRPQSSRK